MTGDRYERLPMAEWVCSEEGYNIGKELFHGTNMVHESSPLSEPLMAAGNFTEVVESSTTGVFQEIITHSFL